ncbi:hypothetical protein AAF712_014700 [Marasmius tenuissimus]|uniref:Uncharacterized protein n=1 Tax=Marasmius tenuissimus TaxID=585030 RepID=A0ABR2ZCA8_9AGAR
MSSAKKNEEPFAFDEVINRETSAAIALGWVTVCEYEIQPSATLKIIGNMPDDLTTPSDSPLNPARQNLGPNDLPTDVRRFLKPDISDPDRQICVFCLLGNQKEVNIFLSTTKTMMIRDHFHACHLDLWAAVLRLERLRECGKPY